MIFIYIFSKLWYFCFGFLIFNFIMHLLLLFLLSRFSCVRLCDPRDSSPPGSAIPGILQARTLEWVAISFSNAWKWKVKVKSFSCVWLFATPWTTAYQAPTSMGFSRQEYWSGVPLPSPYNALRAIINNICFFRPNNWSISRTIYLCLWIFIREYLWWVIKKQVSKR